jgi:hypothetical protein
MTGKLKISDRSIEDCCRLPIVDCGIDFWIADRQIDVA